jgi:hypothetical protein
MHGEHETTALAQEALTAIEATHIRLMQRFARSERNELRVEIILFRSILKEMEAWAERTGALRELVHKASWWWAFWCEKEYGDSEFDDPTPEQMARIMSDKILCYRKNIALWVASLDWDLLASEVREAATKGGPLTSLNRLAETPSWDDLQLLLDRSGPVAHRRIIRALYDGLRSTNPACYEEPVLTLLNQQVPKVRVIWDAAAFGLAIDFVDYDGVLQGRGRITAEVHSWILEERRRAMEDEPVDVEARVPIENLMRELIARTRATKAL